MEKWKDVLKSTPEYINTFLCAACKNYILHVSACKSVNKKPMT